jgi:hypothetical protein
MGKITPEELVEITTLRSKLSLVVGEVGRSTLQKSMLQEDIKVLENTIAEQTVQFQKLLAEEETLVKRLSEKYGTGSIDFETGDFTPEK